MLLPFQRTIVSTLSAPVNSDGLLIIARGLGLRTIVCDLLRQHQGTRNLVLILNATEEEERSLNDESQMQIRGIGYEMPAKERQEAYKKGGILSVTSRILVVDMLNKVIPTATVAGMIVMHAEKVTPTSPEAFICRVYREQNKDGFLKAFSDEPEQFTFGLSPLQTVLTQLKIRNVYIWPRFHADVQEDLQKRRADVIELYQPMTPAMDEIQTAILECMEATLAEIKRSNTSIEVEELTVENALFSAFDSVIRSRLESQWHKVGPRTRSLVADLTTLRKLLTYLLSFDCVAFNQFLETILSANNTNPITGHQRVHKSPWLFLPAADTIFTIARRRVYLKASEQPKPSTSAESLDDEADAALWAAQAADEEALLAMEAEMMEQSSSPTKPSVKGKEKERPPTWMPPGCKAVLEQQPKWQLLSDVLDEIENDLHFSPVDMTGLANDTILIMCHSASTCMLIRRYLADLVEDEASQAEDSGGGPTELRRRLRDYFFWKASLGKLARNLKASPSPTKDKGGGGAAAAGEKPLFESAALKNKRAYQRGQQPSTKRRRVRGGAAGLTPTPGKTNAEDGMDATALETEAGEVADLIQATATSANESQRVVDVDAMPEVFDEEAYNEYFGLCAAEDLVVIRPYSGDEDDRVLEELRPKYVVMFDSDPAFIRRIEVYRSSHPGLNVRVFFLMYSNSVEEQKYLSSIRREKDAFERMIRERGVMAIPLQAERRAGDESNEELLRTISTRIGGTKATAEQPRVIVDVREFRSSLPSLLHAAKFEVVPLTLTIGDYILSPNMCVERKSVPDLIQSFNSGRLYQQCELMSIHYKQPILLIEFDQKKSFNLEAYFESSSKAATSAAASDTDLHANPYATADIFADLKANHDEPEADAAGLVGAEDPLTGAAGDGGTGRIEGAVNQAPQELLRSLPGVTSKNVRYLAQRVKNMEELVAMESEEVEKLIGVEAGRQLVNFLRADAREAL